jgi:uroporphyrinogen-III synthase
VAEAAQSPLFQKRVLITRAEEQSGPLFTQLLALAAIPVCTPMIQFAPAEDSGPLDEALRNFGKFDWMFLTSQNALRFVLERAAALGIALDGASGVRVAAVAPVTAAAAEKAGLRVSYVSKRHRGVALAEELGGQLKGQRVFLPRSDKAGSDLPEALRNAEAEVTDVVAYSTLQTRTADEWLSYVLKRGEIDAMVFFSPSAVHHLADIFVSGQLGNAAANIVIVSIGPVTTQALQESGFEMVRQARDTDTESVVEALVQAFEFAAIRSSRGAKPG